MGFFKEFREFAIKGNMIDMAVGIIIGASFNKVVDVMVKNILMPPLSLLTKGLKFQDRRFVLRQQITDASGEIISDEVAIGYGALFEAFSDFMIIGFTVFLLIKFLNNIREKAHGDDPDVETIEAPQEVEKQPTDNELLLLLTDLMKEQNALLKKEQR